MDDNNNIEEFFNNSLEGFNESPSENVWKEISGRLISPTPLWKRLLWPFITALLLLTIGCITIYTYSLRQQLNQSNQDFAAQSLVIAIQSEKIREFEASTVNLQIENAAMNREINTILTKSKTSKSTHKNWNSPLSIRHLSTINAFDKIEIAPNFQADRKVYLQNFIGNRTKSSNQSSAEYSATTKTESADLSPIQDLAFSSLIKTQDGSAESLTRHKGLNYTLPILPFGNPNTLTNSRPKFKYGITASLVGTKTDVTSSLSAGFNAGLALEMRLYRKLWLTSGIRYNRNTYMMEFIGQNPIEEKNFPTPRSLDFTYDRVDVQNSFFDFPFGINLNLDVSKKNSLFINPGISWQFYLPQKYTYNTTNNGQFDYSENRYFMYFGSAFLNAGFERRLSGNRSLQLSLWAEKGISQYGIENRQIIKK